MCNANWKEQLCNYICDKRIDIWLRPRIGSGYVYTYVASKYFSYLYLDNAALISDKYD